MECSRYVGIWFYFHILWHIFLVNYSGNFAQAHTGNERGHFVLVNVTNTGFLGSCHHCLFLFLCVQFICASGLTLCPAILTCKCEANTQMHMLLFSQGQNNCTPYPWYAAIHALQLLPTNPKPAVTGCSNGQHWDQYSRWRHGTAWFCMSSYLTIYGYISEVA